MSGITRVLESTQHWDLTVRRAVSRVFLLAALAERPMHGYELSQAVAELSGECCAPSDAALYPAIRELTEGGYITCAAEAHGNRRRNVCTLTDRGREALAAAAASWGRVLPHLTEIIEQAPALSADPSQVSKE